MITLLNSSHIDEIAVLERAVFDHFWTEEQIREHLDSGNPVFGDIDDSGKIRGILIVTSLLGEWEIFRIAVAPEFRRMGIAKTLLTELDVRCNSDERIFLEVRVGNIPAQELYRSCGYEECGKRKKYYSDGEDAVLMMKSF